jgi:chromate transporter
MDQVAETTEAAARRGERLRELAWLFLKLGTTAFGGPAAHIAMLEDEVVRRRGWLTRDEFLDLLGATNLIPGPNSTEMAIHVGHRRAGWAGLLVAGSCFILPAVLLTVALAWVYTRFGTLPQAVTFLYGVKAAILAVVLQALWRLGRDALKTKPLAALCLGAIVANALGVHELLVLFGGGMLVAMIRTWHRRSKPPRQRAAFGLVPPLVLLPMVVAGTAVAGGLGHLFLLFLKTGAVLFGSGYVLLAFLRADLVHRWRYLTEQQLLDAIAAGQVTPGPVFSTATFVGYLVHGLPGAMVATAGIFLPAFVFVALSGPLVPRIRRSPAAAAFLDGVVVASLALMGVVTWQLAGAAVVDVPSAALTLVSTVLLVRFRVSSPCLVLGSGLLGLALASGS